MKYLNLTLTLVLAMGFSLSSASADEAPSMTVTLPAIANGAVIPAEYSFCVEDGNGKATLGGNQSPEISWSGAPKGTKSFVILSLDPKVPSKADNVNKEGKVVSKDLPRVDFVHWLLADIPATVTQLPKGAESAGVVAKGKPVDESKNGVRGRNNYGDWFASDKDMMGVYGGYDGPCPPWNDEIVHEYHFEVFALDIPTLGLKAGFTLAEAREVMKGHVLASGKSVGLYKLNSSVKY